jgi:hypothetical protein
MVLILISTSLCQIDEGVEKKDLGKLQPLRKVVQQLRQEGWIGMHLLRTCFSYRI